MTAAHDKELSEKVVFIAGKTLSEPWQRENQVKKKKCKHIFFCWCHFLKSGSLARRNHFSHRLNIRLVDRERLNRLRKFLYHSSRKWFTLTGPWWCQPQTSKASSPGDGEIPCVGPQQLRMKQTVAVKCEGISQLEISLYWMESVGFKVHMCTKWSKIFQSANVN